MKKRGKPRKHISQLDATGQARAQQLMQYALLAIIQSQGANKVAIPYDQAQEIHETHRLKITLDDGKIVLEAEKQDSQIIVPDQKVIQ